MGIRVGLPAKQARFVEEYLLDLTGAQAARRAGYSPNSANVTASKLLSKANIQDAIANAVEERSQRTEIDQDWVLFQLKGVVEQSRAEAANLPVAIKALELIGRHLQMFPTQPPG